MCSARSEAGQSQLDALCLSFFDIGLVDGEIQEVVFDEWSAAGVIDLGASLRRGESMVLDRVEPRHAPPCLCYTCH